MTSQALSGEVRAITVDPDRWRAQLLADCWSLGFPVDVRELGLLSVCTGSGLSHGRARQFAAGTPGICSTASNGAPFVCGTTGKAGGSTSPSTSSSSMTSPMAHGHWGYEYEDAIWHEVGVGRQGAVQR